jgi:hypothetical protein
VTPILDPHQFVDERARVQRTGEVFEQELKKNLDEILAQFRSGDDGEMKDDFHEDSGDELPAVEPLFDDDEFDEVALHSGRTAVEMADDGGGREYDRRYRRLRS